MRYTIIEARPKDVACLAAVELAAARMLVGHAPESVLNDTTSNEVLFAAQNKGHLWVAIANDVPVGFAHLRVLDPEVIHLEEIDVLPEHGRRGIGTQLVKAVCRWAAANGYRYVTLTTFRHVPWNMPFYARLGFEEIPYTEITPSLRSIIADETRRGLDSAMRVPMRILVTSSRDQSSSCCSSS